MLRRRLAHFAPWPAEVSPVASWHHCPRGGSVGNSEELSPLCPFPPLLPARLPDICAPPQLLRGPVRARARLALPLGWKALCASTHAQIARTHARKMVRLELLAPSRVRPHQAWFHPPVPGSKKAVPDNVSD